MNFSAMLTNHPFWGVLTIAVLVWYSTITVYVSIRGAADIKDTTRELWTHLSIGLKCIIIQLAWKKLPVVAGECKPKACVN